MSAREQGVRLRRHATEAKDIFDWLPHVSDNLSADALRVAGESGRWFPEPVAERLIEAERERDELRELDGAAFYPQIERLMAERDARIDPDDPTVRERIADAMDACGAYRENADAILDALRGGAS